MLRNWMSTGYLPSSAKSVAAALVVLPLLLSPAFPQARATGQPPRSLITAGIDESSLVTLRGNVRSAANAQNDLGRVENNLPLDHMLLQLQRGPEEERALAQFIDELHNPNSPDFHHWVTPDALANRFGPAEQDLATVTTWLESHGLTVNLVYPNRMMIDFSGTAGAVRDAFHTEIHRLNVNGETHIANMTDPRIPAALAPVVAGVVALHDFKPRTMHRMHSDYTFTSGGSQYEAVVPADLATIYNFNPLFSAGVTGAGQTIVLIEDTNLYSTTDWTTFRTKFGLSGYTSGSLTTVHPAPASGHNNCTNPGVVVGNDGEAALDVEWASAAAPSATIELASCGDTSTTFGGLIALQNLLTLAKPPSIVSISYGECEAENGASANAAYSSTYQTAAAAGVSVFVSAGDEGAASCDADLSHATHGIGVSGFASTPYNVAVGGTDFGDTYAGTTSSYWSTTNTATFGSALSYVPEIPWNDSCASKLIYTTLGYSASYGTTGFCNSSTGLNDFLNTAAGSGGPSNCATGSSPNGVAGSGCAGWAKPSWQAGVLGNPSDNVRDLPDVSLFAANGVWGHYYVFCYTDRAGGGASCSGAPSTWAGAGGTSFASPILAGIQALVNQKTATTWGNPNATYYKLAGAQYANSSLSCNSTSGAAASSGCVFYDVTLGDMDVVCSGTNSCYGSSTSSSRGRTSTVYGALSTSSTSLSPAYGTTTGWDFATGLGSVNAANLVNGWSAASVPAVTKPQ